MDVLMIRIRKYTTNMPDSVLSSSTSVSANGLGTPRMSSPAPDGGAAGWAGWAISSFTNKIAATNGDIQPVSAVSKTNGHTLVPTKQVNSVPQRMIETHNSNSARRSLKPTISTPNEPADYGAEADAEDFNTEWSELYDEADEEEPEDGASLFDALATPQAISTPTSNQFDDGGEPDFAGWLNAQSQSKSKLKNMKKSTPTSRTAPVVSKSLKQPSKVLSVIPTGKIDAVGKGSTSISHIKTKNIDTKPKDSGEPGGWDAWE